MGYEVGGGASKTHLIPGSSMDWEQYEPLEEWKNRKGEPAYITLAKRKDDPDRLKTWFNEHGPLGLVEHMVERVILWPWWVESTTESGGPWILQHVYRWGGMSHHRAGTECFLPPKVIEELEVPDNLPAPVSRENLQRLQAIQPNHKLQEPHVRFRKLATNTFSQSPLYVYAQFFPRFSGVPESTDRMAEDPNTDEDLDRSFDSLLQNRYPLPVEPHEINDEDVPERLVEHPEYRDHYGEPMYLIQRASELMSRIVDYLATEERDPQAYMAIKHALSLTKRFLPVQDPGSGKPADTQQWHFPSLWAALVHQAVQDYVGPGLRSCEHCGGVFVPQRSDQKYCIESHRKAANQKKYRDRQNQSD